MRGAPLGGRVPGEELRDDNSTLVEFTLSGEGDQARLSVVESGSATLNTTEEKRGHAVALSTEGWPQGCPLTADTTSPRGSPVSSG